MEEDESPTLVNFDSRALNGLRGLASVHIMVFHVLMLSGMRTDTHGQARLCCIEIQVRLILDRDQFLALYLVWRSIFWVSPVQKILFPYTKDTFCGSLDTEPVSCICIADPNIMYRAQPCPSATEPSAHLPSPTTEGCTPSDRARVLGPDPVPDRDPWAPLPPGRWAAGAAPRLPPGASRPPSGRGSVSGWAP